MKEIAELSHDLGDSTMLHELNTELEKIESSWSQTRTSLEELEQSTVSALDEAIVSSLTYDEPEQ